MNLLTLLEMVTGGYDDRVAVGSLADGMTYAQLRAAAARGGKLIQDSGAKSVIFCGENGPSFPIALFGAGFAKMQFLPLNYRLAEEYIAKAILGMPAPFIVTDNPSIVPDGSAQVVMTFEDWIAQTGSGDVPVFDSEPDPEDIALLLQTSGTTSAPKSAVLRHKHLVAYVLGSVDFASADPSDAMVVSVPPYHIAAVANLLSNLYAGRRVVYLDRFTPQIWLDTVEREGVTNAMLVPTMLSRIVEHMEETGRQAPPTLRSLSYGGARIAQATLERALGLFPNVGFVNAYGLTETSSSVAVFGPDDHRESFVSTDPEIRARLGSVGKVLPNVNLQIRDGEGNELPLGEPGAIWVSGEQVSGEYLESGKVVDDDGWFNTRDRGWLDAGSFLFIEGRTDDTIIRGGENIAPAEIEEVIHRHPAVLECAVAGVPDEEWGQRIAAFVVLREGMTCTEEDIKDFCREKLRSSKTPDYVRLRHELLPQTATGKLLRRNLVTEFALHSEQN